MRELNLDDPVDAKEFLIGCCFYAATSEDGTERRLKDMTDEEIITHAKGAFVTFLGEPPPGAGYIVVEKAKGWG